MRPEIKFCGMTREEDVAAAAQLGARYVGVVFAGGPRALTVDRARDILRNVSSGVGRVGVFGTDIAPAAVADVARACGLDVVQLHGDPSPSNVAEMRTYYAGAIWAVVRVRDEVPPSAGELFEAADAVVVDAYSPASLGGTGLALSWAALAGSIARVRGAGRLVLAGGLRPETVGEAARTLLPHVVDVSSGVESSPGIKDHAKLRAFRDAVAEQGSHA